MESVYKSSSTKVQNLDAYGTTPTILNGIYCRKDVYLWPVGCPWAEIWWHYYVHIESVAMLTKNIKELKKQYKLTVLQLQYVQRAKLIINLGFSARE